MATVYRVRCEDNAMRHKVPFDTFSEAADFARHGHICTATHTVEKWETINKLVMKETVRG